MVNVLSKISLFMSVLGFIIMYVGVAHFQYSSVIFSGVALILISFVFSFIAISKREKGFIKYISFLFLIPIIPFVIIIYSGLI